MRGREKMGGGERLSVASDTISAAHLFPLLPRARCTIPHYRLKPNIFYQKLSTFSTSSFIVVFTFQNLIIQFVIGCISPLKGLWDSPSVQSHPLRRSLRRGWLWTSKTSKCVPLLAQSAACSSRGVFLCVHIHSPTFYYSEHTAYELEFDGVKHTSERLPLSPLSLVIQA